MARTATKRSWITRPRGRPRSPAKVNTKKSETESSEPKAKRAKTSTSKSRESSPEKKAKSGLPKRPATGYIAWFSTEFYPKNKKKFVDANGKVKIGEAAKAAGLAWKKMSVAGKENWNRQSREDMVEWMKKHGAALEEHKTKIRDHKQMTKRAPSARALFIGDMVKEGRKKNKKVQVSELFTDASNDWKKLKEKEKEKWKKKANDEKEKRLRYRSSGEMKEMSKKVRSRSPGFKAFKKEYEKSYPGERAEKAWRELPAKNKKDYDGLATSTKRNLKQISKKKKPMSPGFKAYQEDYVRLNGTKTGAKKAWRELPRNNKSDYVSLAKLSQKKRPRKAK